MGGVNGLVDLAHQKRHPDPVRPVTIESLESKLNSPLVPEDSSYSSLTASDVPVYEDPVYEADDRTEALVSLF